MRRRILASAVTVAVVAVLLLGVPLGVAAVVVARQDAERTARTVADAVAARVEDRVHGGTPVDADVLRAVPEGYSAEVRLEGGRTFATGPPPPDPTFLGEHVGEGFTVLTRAPRAQAYDDMARAGLVVVLVAVLAVLAAVTLGLRQARWITAPLDELTEGARRLGSGGAPPRLGRSGMEELDRVADVLERSAERIAATLAGERQFATDASHQLRTPLAALSLRLEEILETDDPGAVREEARIALTQVERLAGVVDHLLDVTRETRAATAVPVELDRVLAQQLQEWRPAFEAAGRALRVAGTPRLRGWATPGGISQVIATLLENSLAHGAGATSVRTRASGTSVVVEVTDEGAGVPAALGARVLERSVSGRSGTGLGLALARDLAEADGGRLELVRPRPATFALFLGRAGDSPPEVEVVDLRKPWRRAPTGATRAGGTPAG